MLVKVLEDKYFTIAVMALCNFDLKDTQNTMEVLNVPTKRAEWLGNTIPTNTNIKDVITVLVNICISED